MTQPKVDLLIVIPLFKAPELVDGLFRSLLAVASEIGRLKGQVVLINDSPGDAGLEAELGRAMPLLLAGIDAELLSNEQNLGFVQTANRGLRLGVERGADVVLLNSDALLTPGALTEMVEVAGLDPLTSVVSPRSNNATLCNSPYPDRFRSLSPDEAVAAHRQIQNRLPRVTYVPTAVGFCLLVRRLMIEEFGAFDTVYGGGYNEENDFIMRCNRRGYRAVLANRAFVLHIGSVSFAQSGTPTSDREKANREILLERYPEYARSVDRYFDGLDFRAQSLLAGLVRRPSNRLAVLFDCNNLTTSHNGTFQLATNTVRAFVDLFRSDYDLFVACSQESLVFHGLDRVDGLTHCGGREREMAPFAYCIRLAQPFEIEHLVLADDLAPVSMFMILDTIAMDCLKLDLSNLDRVWSLMLQTTSVIGYISQFSRDQFHRRFPGAQGAVEYVALCSTDPADYAAPSPSEPERDAPLLLVGNDYDHKHVRDTLACLLRQPDRPDVIVLGLEVEAQAGVVSFKGGDLDPDVIDDLYRRCRAVLYPSHYEGFGLPVLQALSREKVVFARDLPVYREIADASPGGANLRLFRTTEDMVQAACRGTSWSTAVNNAAVTATWSDAAMRLKAALEQAHAALTYENLRSRLALVEVCRGYGRGPQHQTGATVVTAFAGRSLVEDPVDYVSECAAATIRRTLRSLGRLPLLRAVGERLWRGRAASRMARIDDGASIDSPVGRLTVLRRAPSEDWALFASESLGWASGLVMGGELSLSTLHMPEKRDPLSPLSPDGVGVWLTSAGFDLLSLTVEDGSIHAVATRVVDWADILPGSVEDDAFVDALFERVLARPAEGFGKIHAIEELRGGRSRPEVLRHLMTSMERGLLIRNDPAKALGGRRRIRLPDLS